MITELVGIVGSVLVLVSMLYKTDTYRGALLLRVTNLLGSIVFIGYGVMLPAYSTIVLNVICVFVNIYHISRLKHDYTRLWDNDSWEWK